MKNKRKNLIKAVLIFIIYFIYSYIFNYIFNIIFNDHNISYLLSDISFILIIFYFYKDSIIKDFKKLKKIPKTKILKNVFGWFFIILVAFILMGLIINEAFPNYVSRLDSNTYAIKELSLYYSVFKTMIFSICAEELLFKKSISEVINNKVLFVIISTLIYSLVLLVYSGLNKEYLFLDFIKYFTIYSLFSVAYVKNDNNIITLMMIKFVYQIIPLIMLLTN